VGTLVLPCVRFTVTLVVPTAVVLVDNRKCVGSLLVSVIVPLLDGAALSEMLRPEYVLLPTIGLFTVIVGAAVTFTVAVASVMPGESARSVVLPTATPVTLTVVDVLPCGIVTGDCTVAMAELSVVSVKVVPPAGAATERVRVTADT
jgi:hypothetical protein